jgi:glycosyltransferase involved in cell wall biosynthesis
MGPLTTNAEPGEAVTRYVVVTPVRDEEEYLRLTVESIINQAVRPVEYVVVNDGSKDRTGEIIEEYARQYPWIRAVHRQDRGFRKPGGGIIEAFYSGFEALKCTDWEFMSKLDGDLSFAPTYFESIFERFKKNPKLGIAGGGLFHVEDGQKIVETCPKFHVRGGAKVYRRACWDAIGGLFVGPGSDAIDEVKGNMLGWTSESFFDLEMHHHRFTGATYGRWGGAIKDGRADYVCGYHPLFLLAKCGVRMARKPYVIGALAHLYGFLRCYWNGTEQVGDPQLVRYLRSQQMNRLLNRPTIWK